MIIVGADNRPPMLEKSLYDSWKSRMELYMENMENRRMILDSVLNGPLVWPTVVQEGGILGKRSLVVPVFSQGDDPISCLNKAMAFITDVASSRFPSTNNQIRNSSNPQNQATIQDDRVTVQQVQGRQGQSYFGTGYKGNATSSGGNNASGQARITEDLDAYDSDCDDVSNAKAVLMANLSNHGSDIIS
ncbi:hypothetical protein Tco_0790480 [Tanacetum coccineum]